MLLPCSVLHNEDIDQHVGVSPLSAIIGTSRPHWNSGRLSVSRISHLNPFISKEASAGVLESSPSFLRAICKHSGTPILSSHRFHFISLAPLHLDVDHAAVPQEVLCPLPTREGSVR